MPDISSVKDISSFVVFLMDWISSLLNVFKSMFTFVINLFNPKYYYDIFSHLPHPFGSILGTLVLFICYLLLMKLISMILSSIKGGS